MTRTRSGHNYTAKKVKRTRKPKGVMTEQTPQGADPNLLLLMQEMLRDRQQREAQMEEVRREREEERQRREDERSEREEERQQQEEEARLQ